MAETYLQLAQQIEELQQRAATVKEQEMAEVVERIRLAIKAYGLTVEQLFGGSGSRSSTPAKKAAASKTSGKRSAGKSSGARFRDDAGNVWSGRGPRPRWLKTALSAGRSIDEFAVSSDESPAASASRRGAPKPAPIAKYKDDAGHQWSGRGPKPGWYKAALAAGKTPDQLAV